MTSNSRDLDSTAAEAPALSDHGHRSAVLTTYHPTFTNTNTDSPHPETAFSAAY